MRPRKLRTKSQVFSDRHRASSVTSSIEAHDWLKRAKPKDFNPPKSIHIYTPKKSRPILAFKNAYNKPRIKTQAFDNSLEIVGHTVLSSTHYACSMRYILSNDSLIFPAGYRELSKYGSELNRSVKGRRVGMSR
jgi:hypothetical protein